MSRVKGYVKKNGTRVKGHMRRNPYAVGYRMGRLSHSPTVPSYSHLTFTDSTLLRRGFAVGRGERLKRSR